MAEKKKEKAPAVEKRNAGQKKQMYLTRAANTFGAKLTGRGPQATDPNKYLTPSELEAYKSKPKQKKAKK